MGVCLTAPIDAAVCFRVLMFPAVEQVKMIGAEVCINVSDHAGIIHAHKPRREHVSVCEHVSVHVDVHAHMLNELCCC